MSPAVWAISGVWWLFEQRAVAGQEVLQRRHLLEVGRDVRVVPGEVGVVVLDVDDVLVRRRQMAGRGRQPARRARGRQGKRQHERSRRRRPRRRATTRRRTHADADNGVSQDTTTPSRLIGVRRARASDGNYAEPGRRGVAQRVTRSCPGCERCSADRCLNGAAEAPSRGGGDVKRIVVGLLLFCCAALLSTSRRLRARAAPASSTCISRPARTRSRLART